MLRLTAAAVGTGLLPTLPGCTVAPSFPAFRGRPGPRPDPAERWSFLSDVHLCGNQAVGWGGVNMANHARTAVAGVLAGPHTPAGVIVNGDCALELGGADDYRVVREILVAPLASAGLPVHLTLGNHDHRARFRQALGDLAAANAGSDGAQTADPRRSTVVRARFANFFLLDSLDRDHHLAGSIGPGQLRWLATALAAHDDRPAIVVGHHPIQAEQSWFWGNISLLDGEALWDVLDAHPHVKAYVYGHTHRWGIERRGRVHLINLPSTAYVFDPGQPSAWVDVWVGPDGAMIQLRRLSPAGPQRPEESVSIEWA